MILGCIADDFTGATDLANTLVKEGMRVIQMIGVPDTDTIADDADAVVVALKSRSTPVHEAVADSMAALKVLQASGAQQFLFKYCSTFDSTDDGNIGPVGDALAQALEAKAVVVCPAFPETGRTIYHGHLFVGDSLLSESGMENHPLNPMRDADLVRVLGKQTKAGVGLVRYSTVEEGPQAVRRALDDLAADGHRYAVTDAVRDEHLRVIGEAIRDDILVTGGSGIALGLPANFRHKGVLPQRADAAKLPAVRGRGAVLSGSCSIATRGQIANWRDAGGALFQLDVRALANDEATELARVDAWLDSLAEEVTPLIYSSDNPDNVAAIQQELGRDEAGRAAERAMAAIAQKLITRGVRQLVVAGGETSGAVVSALNVRALRIGHQIAPGVPWTVAEGDTAVALALKSGNFGAESFFRDAFASLVSNG